MKPTRRHLATRVMAYSAALLLTTPLTPLWAQPTTVKISGAWARPTAAGQAGGGGFLSITGGSQADRLISGSAPISKAVELHRMDMDGNTMRMRQVDYIDIPANQTVELKPGGLHVMFIGLTQSMKNGATIPLTLRFEKAGEVKVDMKVMSQPPTAVADKKN
jgi:periplasmic copper chaperone A